MKSLAFWILDASVLFSLSLLYLYQGFNRRNQLFTIWLFLGVLMQLAAAWGLAAGWPTWMNHVRAIFDSLMYIVATGVLALALTRRDCPVNRTLMWGLGAMILLNIFTKYIGGPFDAEARNWLRNIAFFGPAIFLLIAFSNLRMDQMPLWLDSVFRNLVAKTAGPAMATASMTKPPVDSRP
jgi:peptidoglycan/LPS O-acetylase OafA/YrhL